MSTLTNRTAPSTRTAPPARSAMGDVLAPGDQGYDEARRTVFATGRPALVVRPHDDAQVAAAVAYAAREGLDLSVRSGGHGLTGRATNDGGLVVDLCHLDSVELVDPHRHVVRVGAGATWGRVAAELAPHGLGISAGDTAGVGVGGLALGGGIGWMVRRHGLTVDNLVAARVVLADGRTVVASADRHAGLFWALRGGGGVGVVTSIDLVAARVGDVLFGGITFAVDDPARLVAGWRDHLRDADEELSSTLVLAPAAGGRPASATVLVCASHDDPAAAARSVEPLRGLGTVVADTVATVPWAGTLADGGHHHPPGARLAARNVVVARLDDDVVAALVAAFVGDRPTMVAVRALGGAVARVLPDETAFAHRGAEALVVGGALVPADADEAAVEEALTGWRGVAAHGAGAYVNFQGTATATDLRAAYPPATLARLRAVARAYDPAARVARHLDPGTPRRR